MVILCVLVKKSTTLMSSMTSKHTHCCTMLPLVSAILVYMQPRPLTLCCFLFFSPSAVVSVLHEAQQDHLGSGADVQADRGKGRVQHSLEGEELRPDTGLAERKNKVAAAGRLLGYQIAKSNHVVLCRQLLNSPHTRTHRFRSWQRGGPAFLTFKHRKGVGQSF